MRSATHENRLSLDRLGWFALGSVVFHLLIVASLKLVGWGASSESQGVVKTSYRWDSPGQFRFAKGTAEKEKESLVLPTSRPTATGTQPGVGMPRIDIHVVPHVEEKRPEEKPTSAGVADGVDMSEVDAAIIAAFRTHWVLPEGLNSSVVQRTVEMDVSILRDGGVTAILLAKPSGSAALDVSALRAAERIKKLPVGLPSKFLGDRYEVRMHFRAE